MQTKQKKSSKVNLAQPQPSVLIANSQGVSLAEHSKKVSKINNISFVW